MLRTENSDTQSSIHVPILLIYLQSFTNLRSSDLSLTKRSIFVVFEVGQVRGWNILSPFKHIGLTQELRCADFSHHHCIVCLSRILRGPLIKLLLFVVQVVWVGLVLLQFQCAEYSTAYRSLDTEFLSNTPRRAVQLGQMFYIS